MEVKMAKTNEVIIEDEESLEELLEEVTVVTGNPKTKLVKVMPLRNSKSFMANKWYILKAGKEAMVPEWVREQLLKEVVHPKIRW
jgi:hypothetical protein